MSSEPLVCDGVLLKMGGGLIQRLQKRYFALRGKSLCYYGDKGDKEPKGIIELDGAKVVFRGVHHDHCCFSIEGINTAKGIKEYFLYTDSPDDRWRWLAAVMAATGRYNFEADKSADLERLRSSPLAPLLEKPENQKCADCGAPIPTWAVLEPFGSLVCIECIGVHRGLWSAKCREVQLDKWPEEDVAFFASRGNDTVNAELEYHVPEAHPKPNPSSPGDIRKAYIAKKYEELAFTKDKTNAGEGLAPVTSEAVESTTANINGPPKFIGVAFCLTLSMTGIACEAVACLTNGFQEVRSPEGKKMPGGGCMWNVPLQIGLDNLQRPLYYTIYKGDEILGTAEVILPPKAVEDDVELHVPVSGKNLGNSVLHLSVRFTKMT